MAVPVNAALQVGRISRCDIIGLRGEWKEDEGL